MGKRKVPLISITSKNGEFEVSHHRHGDSHGYEVKKAALYTLIPLEPELPQIYSPEKNVHLKPMK